MRSSLNENKALSLESTDSQSSSRSSRRSRSNTGRRFHTESTTLSALLPTQTFLPRRRRAPPLNLKRSAKSPVHGAHSSPHRKHVSREQLAHASSPLSKLLSKASQSTGLKRKNSKLYRNEHRHWNNKMLLAPRQKKKTSKPLASAVNEEDPRGCIIQLILRSDKGCVSFKEIEDVLMWSTQFHALYGDLTEFLQSYHSIFVVSPLDDTVALRQTSLLLPSTACFRAQRNFDGRVSAYYDGASLVKGLNSTNHSFIGSISYCCVAEAFDLVCLETVYHRRGYDTALVFDVLHVFSGEYHSFDMFIFSNGVVVWWGQFRRDHWIVEEDFLSPKTCISVGVRERYAQHDIAELFPVWCSYEVDPHYGKLNTNLIDDNTGYRGVPMRASSFNLPFCFSEGINDAALVRFARWVSYDHYLIPSPELARTQVMLAISDCLGRSAQADYFEHVTQRLRQRVIAIPTEFKGVRNYFATRRQIEKLAGDAQVAQLAIRTLKETPDFLWEMPWLQPFYHFTDAQHVPQKRLAGIYGRSDALLELLSLVKSRRFSIFMMSSDVFLIILLVIDVFFMAMRLIVVLYFKVEDR